jgi:EmrB/QacA subfamily drug resistance transporter
MNNKHKILLPIMVASAMNTIDISIINMATPTFVKVFREELSIVSRISSFYYLVLISFLLVAGRIGDTYGYKKPFEWGLFIYTVGNILCSLAPTLALLIAARAFQAVGTSLITATAPAMITFYFPLQERGKAMGLNAVAVSAGLISGPLLGGLILSKFSWRHIYFINIPLGLIALIASKIFIPVETVNKRRTFDYLRTILILVFFNSILFYVNIGSSIGWFSIVGLGLIITSILSLATLVFWQGKAPDSMLDLSIFSNKAFTAGLASSFMYYISQLIMELLVPFLLTLAQYPSEIIGLAVAAYPAIMLMFAPIGGYLSDRINPNYICALGGMLVALSMFLLATLRLSFTLKDVIFSMLIYGIGAGLFDPSNAVVVLNNVSEHRRGVASGILAMIRNGGMFCGVAIGGLITSLRQEYYIKNSLFPTNQAKDVAAIRGMKDALLLALVFAMVCTITSFYGSFHSKAQNTQR